MGKGEEHLLEAVKSQDIPTVQRLIQKGKGKLLGSSKKVNINHQDSEGFSALHQSAVSGNTRIACLLIDANASVDIQDKKGMRPIHYCAWKGKVELVAALLESGSKCNAQALNGLSPLHLAAQYGHFPVCKILLQYGGDPSLRSSDGTTPLDLACEFGRSEVVELFVSSNASVSLLDHYRLQNSDSDYLATSSPLHLAARNGHTRVIKSLLQAGLDINWKTSTGTCLHEAVANERAEIVQLLIDCGIDTTRRSGLGQTALELAKKISKTPTVMDIIRKLSEAQPTFLQVVAITDFKNIYDKTSLAFTKGTFINVIEQNSNGIWKGEINGAADSRTSVGYFPASYVQTCHHHNHNNSMAGSDDSGIHPHDDEVPHWHPSSNFPSSPHYHHQQWSHSSPSKPLHVAPKYINVDPRSNPSHHLINKVQLVNPNVNNPSYDDVICSQPMSKPPAVTPDAPITVSRASQEMVRPHIANPGYEDVLLGKSSLSSPSSTASSYGSARSHPPHFVDSSKIVQQHRKVIASTSGSVKSNNSVDSLEPKQSLMSASDEQVYRWLHSFGMEQYTHNFIHNGYDLATLARSNSTDLGAIGISKPPHRKKLTAQISVLKTESPPSRAVENIPRSVAEWLAEAGLPEYIGVFEASRVNSIQKLMETTWEDLQEMRIEKLGHQKKLLLGITELNQTYQLYTDRSGYKQQRSKEQSTSIPHHQGLRVLPTEGFQQPLLKKPQVQTKPKKAFASFKESPGLSLELQQALNKRQQIIDKNEEVHVQKAPEAKPPHNSSTIHPAVVENARLRPNVAPINILPHHNASQPVPSPQHIAANQQFLAEIQAQRSFKAKPTTPPPTSHSQKVQRNNSNRGPKPSPPKRISSISLEESPLSSPQDPNVDGFEKVESSQQPESTNRSLPRTPISPKSPVQRSNEVFRFPTEATVVSPTHHVVTSLPPHSNSALKRIQAPTIISQVKGAPPPPTRSVPAHKPVPLPQLQHTGALNYPVGTNFVHPVGNVHPLNSQPQSSISNHSSKFEATMSLVQTHHLENVPQIHSKPASMQNPPVLNKPHESITKSTVSTSIEIKSEPSRKPVVTPKPNFPPAPASKPAVMKKPQVAKRPSPNPPIQPHSRSELTPGDSSDNPLSPTSVVKKTFKGELGKRFDLSVLDQIDQKNKLEEQRKAEGWKQQAVVDQSLRSPLPANPAPPSSFHEQPQFAPLSETKQIVEVLTTHVPQDSNPVVTTTGPWPTPEIVAPKEREIPDVIPDIGFTSLAVSTAKPSRDPLDDFEWPAPPPGLPSPHDETPPAFPSSFPQHVLTPPSPGEVRTCFEADQDTGTVKRRPTSVTHRDDSNAVPKSVAVNVERSEVQIAKKVTGLSSSRRGSDDLKSNFYLPTGDRVSEQPLPAGWGEYSLQDVLEGFDLPEPPPNFAPAKPKLPPKMSAKPAPSSTTGAEEKVPPPIPRKTSVREPKRRKQPEPVIPVAGETLEEVENSKARQMLDDIGSMFDNLVQEFDDILS
ncbi:uncharacterized protein LOC143459394 [Clavelina lepadiformis]|uniref:uncharacterized protein LOC143459394 n=1 Tax=Clavelina lepadiformis TaxID=159417 RepID=UPI0040429D74